MTTVTSRSLVLKKGRHRYAFSYREGQESAVLAAMVSLADDERSDFDWFDAAVLSYEMGQPRGMELELERAR